MSFKQALFYPTCFNNLNESHKETWTCSSDNFQYLDHSDNLILSVKNFSVILCHGDVIQEAQEARRGNRDCNSRFHHINLHSREQVVHVSLECLQKLLSFPIASLLSRRSDSISETCYTDTEPTVTRGCGFKNEDPNDAPAVDESGKVHSSQSL